MFSFYIIIIFWPFHPPLRHLSAGGTTTLQIPVTLYRLSEEFRNVAWNAACCSTTWQCTGLYEVTFSADGWYAHAFVSGL